MALADDFDGIIFDYGGVLVVPQTDHDRARLAAIAGLPADEFSERYWAERSDYDQGLITNVEYWSAVHGKPKEPLSEKQIDELTEIDSLSWMRYDPPMWEWIDALRQDGKRVAMLSNMPLDLGEALKTRSDKLDRFHHVTLSYEVRSVKPEPAIYEECLEGIGTPAARTLFLDDKIENVQGAEWLGIRGMLFTTSSEMLKRLRA